MPTKRTVLTLLAGLTMSVAGALAATPMTALASSSNVLANGGFESGASGWTQTSTTGRALIVNMGSARAHGGNWAVWFCGVNNCNDRISHNFAVPGSVSSAVLTYWYSSDTAETTGCYDRLYTQIRTAAGAVIASGPALCNTNSGWVQKTVVLTTVFGAHLNQQLQLSFLGETNATRTSDFYIDDVTLTITTGTAPSPTPPGGGTAGSCPGSQSGCMQAMLSILNNDRAQAGVAPLTLNLTESNGTGSCVGSYGHSVHMAQMGGISHDQFPADVCVSYSTAGENVGEAGYGSMMTDLQKLDSLMMSEPHSPSYCATTDDHACNILNAGFHQVGIGIYADSAGRTWLTEDFTN